MTDTITLPRAVITELVDLIESYCGYTYPMTQVLHAALVEALGPETWTDDGGWTFEIEQPDHIVDANEMVVQPVIGCVQHDCAECKARAAQPTIQESLTVHASAEDYLRYKFGAYRGHFAWRDIEEAYSQGRYDEEQAQGPNPWPDDAPELHYKRGYGVALSDAEEAIDDECRERVVTASDCIEIIRNLGAEPKATE